jgi:hypothetical protein
MVSALTSSHAEAVLGTVAPVASPPPRGRAAADSDAAALAAPALDTDAPQDAAPARRRKGAPDARSSGARDANAGTIHVVVTADSSPYLQWQMRVCYYHYLKARQRAPHAPFRRSQLTQVASPHIPHHP